MRSSDTFWYATAALALFCASAGVPSRADVIVYSTPDSDTDDGEIVPNAPDGFAPNRPNGAEMGNTVILAGGAANLDTVTLQWGTMNNGGPSPPQNITLALYQADGPPDLTGPGVNGSQPGTPIASQTVTTTALETGANTEGVTLTFNFGGVHVPGTLVAIASSSLIGDFSTQTGWIPSSDFTPVVGGNPHGDRAWYGTGSLGSFASDNTWAFNDAGQPNPDNVSNNLMLTFFAASVPEPGTFVLAAIACSALAALGWRRRPARRPS